MADVGAEVAGPRQADLRIHVGAVEIDLAAVGMDDVADLANMFLEHAVRRRIGNHDRRKVPSKEGVKQLFHMYRGAFPDLCMEVQDVLVSGDKAVARVRATGTHQGEFLGMPATGKSVDVQLIDITRFGDDGLAHEHWGVFDALAMMQQLGAIPQSPPG